MSVRLSPTLEDCDIIARRLLRVVRDWRRKAGHRVRWGDQHVSAMIDVVKRAALDYTEFPPPLPIGDQQPWLDGMFPVSEEFRCDQDAAP